jgi:hypothetical protein
MENENKNSLNTDVSTEPTSAPPAVSQAPVVRSPLVTSPAAPEVGRMRAIMAALGSFYQGNKLYVWASALGMVILAILAYFALRSAPVEQKPAKVEIAINALTEAPSGGEQVYNFIITNKDTVKLTNVELELAYPEGLSYLDSTPKATSLSGTTFPVPDLDPNQKVAVIVKTKVQGEINEEKKLAVRLHYRFSNFNSEFVSEATHTVRLIASNVAMELSGPQTTNNAQVVTYTVKYKNNSDEDIENGRIELTYPQYFTFAESEPQPNLAKNVWNVGTLRSGQSGTITFKGSFASAPTGQSQSFVAAFMVLDSTGKFFTQSNATYITSIGSLPLAVSQEVISGAENGIAKPGETMTYKISYRNNTSVPARGAIIVITLDSNAIDFSSLQAEGAQISNNTITWNASSDSKLETLNPNEGGSVQFNATIKNPPVRDTSRNIEVKTAVKMKSNEYDAYLPGNDLAIKISTQASIETSLEHVTGPLPPQVGKETTYRLTMSLKNSTNELTDGIVTAFIPVASTGVDMSSVQPSKETGLVSFDASTGKLTWKVGVLGAHTGTFNPIRKMSINVRLTPSSSQAGKEPELLKSVLFSATDSFTKQSLRLTAESLDTGSLSGSGFYNGTVQP